MSNSITPHQIDPKLKEAATDFIINSCYEAAKRNMLLRITISDTIFADAWTVEDVQREQAVGFYHPSSFLNQL